MERHERSWWAARLAEMEAGASPKSIARQHQVRVQTLLWWKAEFKRQSRNAPKKQRLVSVALQRPSEDFGAELTSERREIEAVVETKRGRLTVRGTLSHSQLSALAEVLRA